ncbi:MAG: hypothetical protein Rpha_2112 [Candidatus Ruthia sp. Apha_13_S6]|nr:hypothetical protein [Candidatus Ruthia sp. Apha_13_S6]
MLSISGKIAKKGMEISTGRIEISSIFFQWVNAKATLASIIL